MATAAIRYDRPAIFKDAWARARQAAAEAAEPVRAFIGNALRTAWATAKAALAPAKAPAKARRFEHNTYATVFKRVTDDGQYHVTVLARQPDGTESVVGAVLVYPIKFGGPASVLAEALRVLGRQPEDKNEQPVQQQQAQARPDPRQLSLVPLLDAAGPHVPGPAHWRDAWKMGDPVPAGWYPPRRGRTKPSRPCLSSQPTDRAIADEVVRFLKEKWCPDLPFPFPLILETVQQHDGVLVCLEAFDGGLAEFRLTGRPGAWTYGRWQYVAGASANECSSGIAWSGRRKEWYRLPSSWVWDAVNECHVQRAPGAANTAVDA